MDVQLSGHTHNGQIFPINFITNRQYLLSWGHLKMGRTHFFVTSGVQGWGPPVRTAGRSEILFIRIRFSGIKPLVRRGYRPRRRRNARKPKARGSWSL